MQGQQKRFHFADGFFGVGGEAAKIGKRKRAELLDRALEFLPDDEEIRLRRQAGGGLTSPELSVLLAYSKIWLTKELNESAIASEPFFGGALVSYFPANLSERFGETLHDHPLRTQIISTVTVNRLLNIAGITFVFRAMEETGASAVEVVRAASASLEIFGIPAFWQEINSQDNLIPTTAQTALHLESRRLLDRATRWFLQTRGGLLDVQGEIDQFQSVVESSAKAVPTALQGKERERRRPGFVVPHECANRAHCPAPPRCGSISRSRRASVAPRTKTISRASRAFKKRRMRSRAPS